MLQRREGRSPTVNHSEPGASLSLAESLKIIRLPGEPFTIIRCDGGKRAVLTGDGWGAAATATFIRLHTALLGLEIEAARTVWVSTEEPTPGLIGGQFREIRRLCVREDVERYVQPNEQGRWDRTARAAALEIMDGLFPTYSKGSVKRMARRRKKGKTAP